METCIDKGYLLVGVNEEDRLVFRGICDNETVALDMAKLLKAHVIETKIERARTRIDRTDEVKNATHG
jgi:hypothetical protein